MVIITKNINIIKFNSNKISVIIPHYNNKDDILNAINSVINQTYTNWELIIVDDHSNDGSYQLIKDFIDNNKIYDIRLIRNYINLGTYVSRNIGLTMMNGNYFFILDSDDVIDKYMFEIKMNILLNNEKLLACKSKARYDDGKELFGEICTLYNKQVIELIGYFDCVRFGADSEYDERLKLKYNDSIYYLDDIFYYIKQRSNSLTRSKDTGARDIRDIYVNNYRKWHLSSSNLYLSFNIDDIYKPYSFIKNRNFDVPEIMLPIKKV